MGLEKVGRIPITQEPWTEETRTDSMQLRLSPEPSMGGTTRFAIIYAFIVITVVTVIPW